MKLNKVPKRSETEEQQFYRSKRKRLVQEDKEKEWEFEVKEFLGKSTEESYEDNILKQRQECLMLDCCDCESTEECHVH